MFEDCRCQRGATPQDKVRAVLRLDAANALDDVRSKALERAPFKTFRTVGSDIFCCRIEAVRNRTARRLWPETRPDIVGATAEQQIEALAMRGGDYVAASGGPIGRRPVAVGEVAVFAGDLDHAVQRDVFDDFELSHLSLRVVVSTPRSRHQVMCVVCPTDRPFSRAAGSERLARCLCNPRRTRRGSAGPRSGPRRLLRGVRPRRLTPAVTPDVSAP